MTWNSFLLVQEINKLYEAKQNFKQAIVYYEEATDLFQSEDVTASANQCSQKTTRYFSNNICCSFMCIEFIR